MRRVVLCGLAALLPVLGAVSALGQDHQAPIVATPLLPPTVQYPPTAPPAGQPQAVQPSMGQPSLGQPQAVQPSMGQQPAGQPSMGQQPAGQAYPGAPQATQPGGPMPPQNQGMQPPAFQQPLVAQPSGGAATGQPPQGQQLPSQQGSVAPMAPVPGQPAAQDQGQQPAAPAQPPPPNPWLPQGGAVLQVLDKINVQASTMTIKVGQTGTVGSLSISVQACLVRPPDMPQDATAFLTITDSHPDQPGFKGWMLKSDPSLSMLEHPLYDVRVIGCTP